MRLSLSVLLVTLALYCYEANASACPDFLNVLKDFVFQDPASFKATLQEKYNPPEEVLDDYLKVKKCSDQISEAHKNDIGKAVERIGWSCT